MNINCPKCSLELILPDDTSPYRHLECPTCGHKFQLQSSMKNLLKIFAPENRSLLCTLIICATAVIIAFIFRPARYQISDKTLRIFDTRSGRTFFPAAGYYFELDGTKHRNSKYYDYERPSKSESYKYYTTANGKKFKVPESEIKDFQKAASDEGLNVVEITEEQALKM